MLFTMMLLTALLLAAIAMVTVPAIICNLNGSGSCLAANGIALIFGPLLLLCGYLLIEIYRAEKARKQRESGADDA